MQTPKVVAVSFLAILLIPGFTSNASVAISAGDSVTFLYLIHAYTLQVSGHRFYNSSTTQRDIQTIDILNVNTTGKIGEVTYRLTIPFFNSTTLATPTVGLNKTAIFNPYDNDTYIGRLGFYPFTYTNLPEGSAKNLTVGVSLLNYPGFNGTVHVNSKVNATVTRDSHYIYVNAIVGFTSGSKFYMAMKYNATTGVLFNMTTRASFLGTPQVLTYQMMQYTRATPPSFLDTVIASPYLPAAVAVAIVAVLGTYEFMHRKTGKAKRAEHIKHRLRR